MGKAFGPIITHRDHSNHSVLNPFLLLIDPGADVAGRAPIRSLRGKAGMATCRAYGCSGWRGSGALSGRLVPLKFPVTSSQASATANPNPTFHLSIANCRSRLSLVTGFAFSKSEYSTSRANTMVVTLVRFRLWFVPERNYDVGEVSCGPSWQEPLEPVWLAPCAIRSWPRSTFLLRFWMSLLSSRLRWWFSAPPS